MQGAISETRDGQLRAILGKPQKILEKRRVGNLRFPGEKGAVLTEEGICIGFG